MPRRSSEPTRFTVTVDGEEHAGWYRVSDGWLAVSGPDGASDEIELGSLASGGDVESTARMVLKRMIDGYR